MFEGLIMSITYLLIYFETKKEDGVFVTKRKKEKGESCYIYIYIFFFFFDQGKDGHFVINFRVYLF